MNKVISVLNNKGGVLKTTTMLNIAVILANKNKRVLVIDADAQANATASFKEIFNNHKFDNKYNLNESNIKNVNLIKTTIYDLMLLQSNQSTDKIMNLINKSIFKEVYSPKKGQIEHINKEIKANQAKINFYSKSKNKSPKIENLILEHKNKINELNKESNTLNNNKNLGSIDLISSNSKLQFLERNIIKDLLQGDINFNPNQKLSQNNRFNNSYGIRRLFNSRDINY